MTPLQLRRLQWLAAMLALSVAGCGGQSGAEGERPGAPCAYERSFVVGQIEEVGGSCVSVRVERVLASGDAIRDGSGNVIFEGNPQIGDVLHGHLRSTYAYTHDFEASARVALFMEAFDTAPALQLFPLEGDRVQLHWAGKLLEAELGDMLASDCSDRLEALREAGRDDGRKRLTSGGVARTPTAPPDDSVCTP